MPTYLLYYCKSACAPCVTQRPKAELAAAQTKLPLIEVKIDDVHAPAPALPVFAGRTVADLMTLHRVKSVPTVIVVNADGDRIGGFTGGYIIADSMVTLIEDFR